MNTNICKDCQHFHQHYIKCGKKYKLVWCGHCDYPRLKKREAGTPACEHFVPEPETRKKEGGTTRNGT